MFYYNIFSKDPDTNKVLYEALRFQIISQVEEGGELKTAPYVDIKGIPTIGIGLNLQTESVRNAVFDKILGTGLEGSAKDVEDTYKVRIFQILATPQTPTTKKKVRESQGQQLQIDLNTIMLERASDARITFSNKRPTFTFTDHQEIKETFESLAQTYEDKVDNWLPGIPRSTERTALFSLAYNQVDTNPLLGPKLKAAIKNGNRPEAWYQIRYVSNADNLPGLAKRRYYESQIFSLYNNRDPKGEVSTEEATKVEVMFNAHASNIKEYENKVVEGHRFGDMVAEANTDFHKVGIKGDVQTSVEARARAKSQLISTYLPNTRVNQIVIAENPSDTLIAAASISDPQVTPAKVESSAGIAAAAMNKFSSAAYGDDYYYDLPPLVDDDGNYYYSKLPSDQSSTEFANSLMIGNSASNTFYFSSISGSDHIVTSANDGIIVIGNGRQSILISGNALQKTDDDGNAISGIYTLGNLDIHKVGNGLVITNLGANISNAATGKITTDNFPFDNEQGAFGITLAKIKDLRIDGKGNVISKTGYDIYSKSLTAPKIFFSKNSFKTADGKGFFALLTESPSSPTDADMPITIGKFNDKGDLISEQALSDYPVSSANQRNNVISKYSDAATGKNIYLYPFSVENDGTSDIRNSKIGFALIDEVSNLVSASN